VNLADEYRRQREHRAWDEVLAMPLLACLARQDHRSRARVVACLAWR
jgi:hypothetical protein